MRIYPSFITSLLALFFLFSACSIERHHYTGGFHFNRSSVKKPIEARKDQGAPLEADDSVKTRSEMLNIPEQNTRVPLASAESVYDEYKDQKERCTVRGGRMEWNTEINTNEDSTYVKNAVPDQKMKAKLKRLSNQKYLFLGALILLGLLFLSPTLFPIFTFSESFVSLGITFLTAILLAIFIFNYKSSIFRFRKELGNTLGQDQLWTELERLEKTVSILFWTVMGASLMIGIVGRFIL